MTMAAQADFCSVSVLHYLSCVIAKDSKTHWPLNNVLQGWDSGQLDPEDSSKMLKLLLHQMLSVFPRLQWRLWGQALVAALQDRLRPHVHPLDALPFLLLPSSFSNIFTATWCRKALAELDACNALRIGTALIDFELLEPNCVRDLTGVSIP